MIIFFFSAIFFSTFLPADQPVLHEGYFAIVFAIILLRYLFRLPYEYALDTRIFWLFSVAIVAVVITSVFSISRGNSLLMLIRYLEGLAAYIVAPLFLRDVRFARYMVVLGTASACMFLFALFFPAVRSVFPEYTTIIAYNGHHPIIYTILLTMPFLWHVSAASVIQKIVIGIMSISALFSAARGGWIIASGFLCLLAVKGYLTVRRSLLWMSVTVLFVLTVVTTVGTPYISRTIHTSTPPFLRGFIKDTNLVLRQEYAVQAFRAFIRAPLKGHGPGTFALLSRKYESQPGWYAQHAHSFPLETLAETGILGSISIGILFLAVFFRAHAAIRTKKNLAYGTAIILLIVYSMFDVPFHHLPHWILFWATVGAIATPHRHRSPIPLHAVIVTIWIILTMFSLSFVLTRWSANPITAAIAPYDPSIAKKRSAERISDHEKQQILFWHRDNTDVLYGMANNRDIYERVIHLAPNTTQYLASYIMWLTNNDDPEAVAELLCRQTALVPGNTCPLRTHNTFLRLVKERSYFLDTLRYLSGNDGYGKFFYFLGVTSFTYTGDKEVTLFLWRNAMERAPQWAFYYLEVAGAYYHWFGDTAAATETIRQCMNHPLAKHGCTSSVASSALLAPMLYSRDILAIPALQ